jgi:hypothetical protein
MTSNEEFKSVSLPLSPDESVISFELLARLLDARTPLASCP